MSYRSIDLTENDLRRLAAGGLVDTRTIDSSGYDVKVQGPALDATFAIGELTIAGRLNGERLDQLAARLDATVERLVGKPGENALVVVAVRGEGNPLFERIIALGGA